MSGYHPGPYGPTPTAPRRRNPAVPFALATGLLIALPLAVVATLMIVLPGDSPAGCEDTGAFSCMSPRETTGLIAFLGAFLVVPLWLATMVSLGLIQLFPQARPWPAILKLALALPAGAVITWAGFGFWTL